MLKKALLFCGLLLIAGNCFANDVPVIIEINGVIVGGGLIHVAVFSNENDFKKGIRSVSFILEPATAVLNHELELSEGEYVVSVFQDVNNNGIQDDGAFGIPKEPVGVTNYNLRGAPGTFKNLKVPVNNNSTRIVINMGRVRVL